ncbi:ankyrin repeat domain-containing protein [Candidatus Mesenet endosymbiont of Agriotes lineatus]|uniref:ankyrin repeat domain-containing protein n=1 Tax=Candidatus Mesenet endosymbiont of Agriotes lineatus TaxID=3077948 RepID=UPI0030CF5E8F
MQLNDQKIQEYQPCKNDDQKCLDYNRLCALAEEEKIKQKCLNFHLFCSIVRNNIESVRYIIDTDYNMDLYAFGFKDLPDDKSCPTNNEYHSVSTEKRGSNEVSINPLMLAAYVGNKNIVYLLIKKGAHKYAQDYCGNTLFHYAGSKEVVKLLRDVDIGIKTKNRYGRAPLHEVIRSLNKKRNDHNAIKKIENTVIKLIEVGADISSIDDYRYTPLHYATHFDNIRISKFILEKIVQQYLNPRDESGGTPLHKAAYNGNLEIVDILINSKVNINTQDKHGDTPLHTVIASGRERAEDIVGLLLKKGATVTIRDSFGRTPLDLARDYEKDNIMKRGANYTNIVNLLEEQMITKKPIISSTIEVMAESTTHLSTADSPLDIKSTMDTIRESNRRNGYTEEVISSTTTYLLEKEGRRVSRNIRQRVLLNTENVANKVKNIEGKRYQNNDDAVTVGALLFFSIAALFLIVKTLFTTKRNYKAINSNNKLSEVTIAKTIAKDVTKQ